MRVFQLVFCLALAICLTVGCSRKSTLNVGKASNLVDGQPNYNTEETVVNNGILYLTDGQGPSFNAIPTGLARPVIHNFILTNRSSGSAEGINLSLNGVDYGIEHSDCLVTLAAGASCTISVGFRPSQVGNFKAVLKITQTNGAAVEREINGSGVVPPLGHLTFENAPDPGNFGATFPNSAGITHPFYLRNDGNGPLNQFQVGMPIDNTMLPSPFFKMAQVTSMPGDAGTPLCSALSVLDAGKRCGFVVQFLPQAPAGTVTALQYGAAIPIQFVDSSYRQVVWVLRGTSSLPPVLDMVDIAPNVFTNVAFGATAAVCMTVRNTHAALPAEQVTAPASLPAPFAIDNAIQCANVKCAALPEKTLLGGASCDIPIRFTPPAAGGAHSISVSVGYFNGMGQATEAATVSASSLNNCTFNFLKPVFNNGATWVGVMTEASGSTVLRLPADAKNITAKMTRVDVDDYGAKVSVNGAVIYDNSSEWFSSAHSNNVNVPFVLNAGVNSIAGSAKDYIWQPTSLSIQIQGAYQTAGACEIN